MKYLSLYLFLFLGSIMSYSQQYYPLHPSIGDTLDRSEKLDYALFPKVSNPGFQYAVIGYENESYYLLSFYDQQAEQKAILTQEEIIEAQKNIEKINAYYRLMAKQDSVETATSKKYPDAPTGKAPVLMNGALSDEARKQARMYQRLQDDQRRMREQEMGIRQNELRIEFR